MATRVRRAIVPGRHRRAGWWAGQDWCDAVVDIHGTHYSFGKSVPMTTAAELFPLGAIVVISKTRKTWGWEAVQEDNG